MPSRWVSFVAVMAILNAPGCSTSPRPPAATSTVSVPVEPPSPETTLTGEQWRLTATLKDFTGPEDCSNYAQLLGQPEEWSMTIERLGDSIRLDTSGAAAPDVHILWNGTVVSTDFTATTTQAAAAKVCALNRDSLGSEWRVSGRFSDDGDTLTATEVGSFQLTTGEPLVFLGEWTARRQ